MLTLITAPGPNRDAKGEIKSIYIIFKSLAFSSLDRHLLFQKYLLLLNLASASRSKFGEHQVYIYIYMHTHIHTGPD